eukprot:2814003-Heterocapsa_arctica.AAC.1
MLNKAAHAASYPWGAACSNCGKECNRTSGWAMLGRQTCRRKRGDSVDGVARYDAVPEASSFSWKQGGHLFISNASGAECQRCNLTCATVRVVKASKGKCPALGVGGPR